VKNVGQDLTLKKGVIVMNRKTKTVLAVLLIAAVMLVSCGNKTENKVVGYTLDYGETLWEIYEEYGNGMVWGKWLYEMEKLNGKCSGEEWKYGEEITVICTK
jgi:hypothetical protein